MSESPQEPAEDEGYSDKEAGNKIVANKSTQDVEVDSEQ